MQLRQGGLEGAATELELGGVAPELLAQAYRHGILQVGAADLDHVVEPLLQAAQAADQLAQGVALEGMRLLKEWLPMACRRGDNVTARAHMMAASTMGASAFQKGLGAMHAMSHPCGAVLNTHHGLTNAVVMPYVLVFNRTAIEDKITALARYLDLPDPSFQAVVDWVERTEHLSYSPDNVLVGPGTKELMFLVQLVYYGDLVIPTPSWVSYAPQAHIIGRHIRWLPTTAEDGSFHFPHLAPGTYFVNCDRSGARSPFGRQLKTVEVRDGEVTRVKFAHGTP